MKHRIRRNQRRQGGWFRALGEVVCGKSRADLAIRLPEGQAHTPQVSRQRIDSLAPMRRLFLLGFLGAFLAATVSAQKSQNIPDVTAITLEDLMNMQVTSV